MIVTAIIWNIFYYRGVQSEKVHEFQLIVMFQPLLTIILAALFLKGEQNFTIIAASLVASIALIASHINKQHLEFSRGSWYLIWAVIFMSIELIISKVLLEVISPVAFYFVRTGILTVFFMIFYHPNLERVANTNALLIFATSLMGVIQMITKYYGFQQLGVVYTSLILMLAPILVYAVSTIWMHERLKIRTVLSAAVILICVIYATMFAS